MKNFLHSLLGLALIINLSAQADKTKSDSNKDANEHKDMKIVSYLIGADIGTNMKRKLMLTGMKTMTMSGFQNPKLTKRKKRIKAMMKRHKKTKKRSLR